MSEIEWNPFVDLLFCWTNKIYLFSEICSNPGLNKFLNKFVATKQQMNKITRNSLDFIILLQQTYKFRVEFPCFVGLLLCCCWTNKSLEQNVKNRFIQKINKSKTGKPTLFCYFVATKQQNNKMKFIPMEFVICVCCSKPRTNKHKTVWLSWLADAVPFHRGFKGISPITSVKDSRSALILLIWTANPLQIDCYACLCPFWFVWNSFQWFGVENPCAAISQLGTSICQNLWIWQNRTRVRPLRGIIPWWKFAYRF